MRSMLSVAIRLGFLLAALLPGARPAHAQDVMDHVRADRWAEAQAAVAGHPDPVARKLVAWMRLMAPGQGRVDEIGAFLATNPDWPMQVSLARRRDEALALEPDNALARAECKRAAPTLTGALLRCADALAASGETAAPMLKAAWATAAGDAAWEARFIARWSGVLSREDHLKRFEQLGWTDPAAARRQADRLDKPWQAYTFLAYICFELKKFSEALEAINAALQYPEAGKDSERLKKAIEDAIKEREALANSPAA